MWSAGCTLCELFTGNVTFPGVSNNDMLRCIQNIKGPMPHHMVKKHIKSYIEMGREPMYTEDFKFKYYAMVSSLLLIAYSFEKTNRIGFGYEDSNYQNASVHKTNGDAGYDYLPKCGRK